MSIRAMIKPIIERSDTKLGMAFDLLIQSLIIISLISFSFETLPDLTAQQYHLLWQIEVVCVAVFTLEYFARIYVADSRKRFIFSFLGLLDLIAILPFYLALGVDLRSARVFRMFRVLRIFKLARYSRALHRLHIAFRIAKEELALFMGFTLAVLYLAAVGIYFFEHPAQPDSFSSVLHSLWWAVATLTTVGYGDIYPITVGGKIFTFFTLIIGLGIVAIPAGMVASALSKARELEAEEIAQAARAQIDAHTESTPKD